MKTLWLLIVIFIYFPFQVFWKLEINIAMRSFAIFYYKQSILAKLVAPKGVMSSFECKWTHSEILSQAVLFIFCGVTESIELIH